MTIAVERTRTGVRTESLPCNQCGSENGRVIAHGTDREYYSSDDVYSFMQCDRCGLIYLNPRPVVSELSRIYPPNYHSYILAEAVGSKGSFITRMRQKSGARRFLPVMRHLKSHPKVDLLDVGCGNGWMMQVFQSLDPARIRPAGIEISEDVCVAARKLGFKVYCGRFEDVNLEESYDVVNLTHVIEHVSDPRLVVRKAYDALRPGGLLVLETPNIGSVEWPRFRAGNWGAYHIPRHWYLYNRDTIRQLGQAEGFAMVDWYCHPGATHWVWTMHNVCLSSDNPLLQRSARFFDPIRVFRRGLIPTAVMGTFFLLDVALKTLGMQTSVMTGIFRKP